MDLRELSKRAMEIREKYHELEMKKYGKAWTNSQIMEGFVGDVGDLMKLVMAKEGIREIENADEKITHELSDCLWCILVLADKFGVDLEKSFVSSMNLLESRIKNDIS